MRTIITTTARLDDADDMARFLAPIPNGVQLAKVLEGRTPVSTRAYEDETETARFVESDGKAVVCFAIPGITIDEAEMITVRWEGVCTLDPVAFAAAVQEALHEGSG
jgi:hypothetical protein